MRVSMYLCIYVNAFICVSIVRFEESDEDEFESVCKIKYENIFFT